jgi:hypothetical protein
LNRLIEIEHPAFSRQIEDAERSGDAKTPAFRGARAFSFVDEQQIGVKPLGERDRSGLPFVEPGDGSNILGFDNLEPDGRARDPATDCRRRQGVGEFGLHGARKNHSFKQVRQNIDMADENEVISRAGVGDD